MMGSSPCVSPTPRSSTNWAYSWFLLRVAIFAWNWLLSCFNASYSWKMFSQLRSACSWPWSDRACCSFICFFISTSIWGFDLRIMVIGYWWMSSEMRRSWRHLWCARDWRHVGDRAPNVGIDPAFGKVPLWTAICFLGPLMQGERLFKEYLVERRDISSVGSRSQRKHQFVVDKSH